MISYGNYKRVVLVNNDNSLKANESYEKIRFKLYDGQQQLNVSDGNAKIVIKNKSGYLFYVNTAIVSGEFVLDFTNELVKSLTPDDYFFQIDVNISGSITKYPDNDFVPFKINVSAYGTQGKLVPYISFEQVLDEVDTKVNNYLSTVVKGDKGDKGDSGKDAAQTYLSVVDYGADINGVNDSSDAFINALSDSKNNNHYAVFVPKGNYLISKPILIDDNRLFGENKNHTILKLNNSSASIKVGLGSTLSDFMIDISGSGDGTIALELGCDNQNIGDVIQYRSADFSSIDRIVILDDGKHTETVGIYAKPSWLVDTSGSKGVWGNYIHDIQMWSVGTGLLLDSQTRGWINSNSFRDINIRGFQKFGVSLTATQNNPLGISHNVFDAITVESRGTTPVGATAFNISAGEYNFFDHCSTWDDAGGGRNDVIQLNFSTSVGYPNPYDISNNNFDNMVIENYVTGNRKIIALNSIDVYTINGNNNPKYPYSSMMKSRNSGIDKPSIMGGLVQQFIEKPDLSVINFSSKAYGRDEQSDYINLDGTTKSETISLNVFGNPLNQIIGRKFFSVSIRFRAENLTNSSPITTMFGTKGKDRSDINANIAIDHQSLESVGKNEYVYHANYDLSSITLNTSIAFISLIATINTDGQKYLIRDIKVSSEPVINWSDYKNVNHAPFETKLSTKPSSWEDLGVFLPNKNQLNFDESLISIKNVNNSFYITTPFVL
ncbi:MAG: glycoside hydrolase family 55 protein [Leuconostoc mesenteroides]|jgi:hypothetical protein|nr:glycoside hydrolase family 55 protein [Leuconostoc mesenteroides]